MNWPFPRKTTWSLLAFVAIMIALPYLPFGEGFRGAMEAACRKLGMLPLKPVTLPVVAVRIPPKQGRAAREGAGQFLHDDQLLDPFYQSLWRSQTGPHVTRILHYGDSPTTADLVTADVRSLLQKTFGDAGHGFVLLDRPWAWYGHRGIGLTSDGWSTRAATLQAPSDGLLGLGGATSSGGPGAHSLLTFGPGYAHLQVQFSRQPNGGTLIVTPAASEPVRIATSGEPGEPGFVDIPLPAAAQSANFLVEGGPVRVFGVMLQRGRPGVIYNSLGVNGGQVQALLRTFQPAAWAEQLRHAQPDLVVLNYGDNESVYPKYVDGPYANELTLLIQRMKAALPGVPILIMAPMDRGVHGPGGELLTPPVMQRIVDIQKKVALQQNCAFFDTFTAMGGAGTMARWYTSSPRLVSADLLHPNPQGAAIVGRLLYDGLMAGYKDFRRNTLRSGGVLTGEPVTAPPPGTQGGNNSYPEPVSNDRSGKTTQPGPQIPRGAQQ